MEGKPSAPLFLRVIRVIRGLFLYIKMKSERLQDVYKLSPMQEGMLFHSLLDEGTNPYFEQTLFHIKGEIDYLLLEKSFNLLIRRYDILRTIFRYENLKQPLQILLRERHLKIYFENISQLNKEKKETYLEEFKRKDRKRKFDLSTDLLMRISLFRTGRDSYRLLWSSHHIIMDGWCLGIIFKDLLTIYRSLIKGKPPNPGPVTPYKKYINWLEKQDKAEGLRYWREYLEGFDQPTGFPGSRQSFSRGNEEPEEYFLTIEKESAQGLEAIARENQVTANSVFQALWGILLQGYNHNTDVVFGAVVSGRPPEIEDIENMVGLFVNTVPVRIQAGCITDFSQLVREVHRQAVMSKPYEYLPLAEIQANSSLKNRLIDHLMGFQNYPIQEEVRSASSGGELGFVVERMEYKERTNYDLNCLVSSGEKYLVKFNFNPGVYSREFIKTTALRLKKLIKQVVKNHQVPLKEIEIILAEEKNRLLHEFNDTGAAYPRGQTIHALFEEQAGKAPDSIAVVGSNSKHHFTYRELNKRSDQSACFLSEKGVQPDTIVGIMQARSLDMIVGLLGILKSGGSYLPIDPAYPQDRIDYMLKDSGASILLTSSNCQLSITNCQWETGDSVGNRLACSARCSPGVSFHRSSFITHHSNLAYIIYTSGSTGKPKGVMIEHCNVVRLVENCNFIDFTPGDRLLLTGAIVFDITTFEIWGPLLNGLTLFLADRDDILDAEKLGEILHKNKISILHLVPQLFERIAGDHPGVFAQLKYFLVGGDVVRPHRINQLRKKCKNLKILHMYGPTENTVFSTFFTVDKEYNVTIPIGKPVSHSTVYIVDKLLRLKPVGAAGELIVGGAGVARGYLNNPALTAERFLYGPRITRINTKIEKGTGKIFYSKKLLRGVQGGSILEKSPPGRRRHVLYRTGDLARWLLDGNIEFLGRIDHQVKIRGIRIEPAEIEHQLLSHETIKEAVVLDRNDGVGEKYLCAYFVAEHTVQNAGHEGAELREYLSQSMADYMIPAYFIQLEKIPLTANGKIDRDALPEPETEAKELYAPPRDEVENQLAKIWSEVLGPALESIGIDDNFFHRGGHSLKAMTLISKMHQALDIKVPLTEIFKRPTIRGLSAYINGSEAVEDKYIAIEPAEKKHYYPLSSLQKRLFILNRVEGIGTAYNMTQVMTVEGELRRDSLEKAFRLLVQRHESLRTYFEMIKNDPVQRIKDNVEFGIECFDFATGDTGYTGEEKKILTHFVRPFDLSRAPLLRVGLIAISGEKHLLLFDMHHIISDGTSMAILAREVIELYRGDELPLLRLQYKDFTLWQNNGSGQALLEEQETYWLDRFKGELPELAIFTDFPRPQVQSFAGSAVPFVLEKEIEEKIFQLNRDTGTTLYMVLLAVLNIALARYTGQEDIIIGTPVAGRQHPDFNNIIGLFINPLVMRNFPRGEKTIDQFLKEVKNNTLRAFRHQEYPFGRLLEKLEIKKDFSRNALFDVELAVQNMESTDMQIQGLRFRPYEPFNSNVTQVDIAVYAVESDKGIDVDLVYCTALFKPETMERFAAFFREVLSCLLEDRDIQLKDINLAHAFGEAESAYKKESIEFDF